MSRRLFARRRRNAGHCTPECYTAREPGAKKSAFPGTSPPCVVYTLYARAARVYTTAMFVRWQKYRNKPATTAILVEGVRVDGKPRQRHLAYLGSFRSEWVKDTHY